MAAVDVQRRGVELSVFLVVAAVQALLGGLWAASRWTAFPD